MKLQKELPVIAIVLLPFIYLAMIWNQLPEKVPVHWNLNGDIDRYGSKLELMAIPFLLPLLVYVLFLIVPKIDPKNKLNQMGNKLHTFKIVMTSLMSVTALLIIYSAKNLTFANPNYITLFVGVAFLIMGNYMKTIRPNYFIGIRTPWTLENEKIWKETHTLGGKMWVVGGLAIVLLSLMLEKQLNFVVFLVITGIITITPLVYSYILFNRHKKEE